MTNPSNALVVQCGAPTAVINASLAAIIDAWNSRRPETLLFGGRYGLRSLISRDWADLSRTPESVLSRLMFQPGSALGGGRDRLSEVDIPTMLDHFQEAQIGTLFLIGGNGTMRACHWLSHVAQSNGYPLCVIGVPKTIDNDIPMIDATPGYGSAARYLAQTVYDAGIDLVSMQGFDTVAIIEAMGRNAGWLTAASALARYADDAPPHIILLPEVPIDEIRLLEKVNDTIHRQGVCMIITAESVRDASGRFLAEREREAERDASGQRLLAHSGGAAPYLAAMIKQELGVRTRHARPDNLQRNCSTIVSDVDRALAQLVGKAAVTSALEGATNVMVGLQRYEGGWRSEVVMLTSLEGAERILPAHFFNPAAFDITAAFQNYARPLAGHITFAPPLNWL